MRPTRPAHVEVLEVDGESHPIYLPGGRELLDPRPPSWHLSEPVRLD